MPMNKDSTLVFFVKSLQSDSTFFKEESQNSPLTEMEEQKAGPSELSIDSIMNFARSYEVLETEEAGYVEMILN